jgi:hypothetical protein
MSIWSTPKNAQNHAKQIRQKIDNCLRYDEPPSLQPEE